MTYSTVCWLFTPTAFARKIAVTHVTGILFLHAHHVMDYLCPLLLFVVGGMI